MNTINRIVAKAVCLALLAFIVAAAVSQAQTLDEPDAADIPGRVIADFRHLSQINPEIIKAFEKAWQISRNGASDYEGVVLIFRTTDRGYQGLSLSATNEIRKFTFKWNPAVRAIVHTHPNNSGPGPSLQDQQVAEKYGVPIFTITISGMFAYNPSTRMTSKVMNRLDWLKPAEWQRTNAKRKDTDTRSLAAGY